MRDRRRQSCGDDHGGKGTRSAQGARTGGRSEADKVRDVVHAWIRASLAGDATAMCALVHPAKLQYLEQIDHPCEDLMSGTLTDKSARDAHSTTIASVDIHGDTAVAHIRSLMGARDLELARVAGTWLIRQF